MGGGNSGASDDDADDGVETDSSWLSLRARSKTGPPLEEAGIEGGIEAKGIRGWLIFLLLVRTTTSGMDWEWPISKGRICDDSLVSGVEHTQAADAGVEDDIVLSMLFAVNVEAVVTDDDELTGLNVLAVPEIDEDPCKERSKGLRGTTSLVSSSLVAIVGTIRSVDVGDSRE